MTSPATSTSERFEVTGIVQGVGFRPFVYRLATELGIRGVVGNDATRVFIEATGRPADLDRLEHRLTAEAPPLALIERITRSPHRPDEPATHFHIADSRHVTGPRTLVPPDTAVCDDCLSELFDPADRRHGHPFITCTNCGPRFTIITDLPYDRPNTTLASFPMCPRCAAEYHDPANRRYHAQPIGCHDCGPTLGFVTADGRQVAGVGGLVPARELLRTGGIVAIKGLGGFHLAVDATDDAAVTRLRSRKHRPDKPLAVMVPDLDAAGRLVHLDPAEARLLSSPARPVLLARRRADARLAPSVAPDNPMLGVMLAYTPVHHLLLAELDIPLVMTSANVSGEPIVFRDADIDTQVGPVADALLTNDRPIVAPCDDSVVRMAGQHLLPVRRARGYAPVPVAFEGGRRAALAVGGELKNTFCLTDGDHAWVSPHIGDMGALATLRTFEQTVARFQTMCGVEPHVIATDAHPGYVTSRWARRAGPADAIHEVQHHHAHVAAVMAEHRLPPATPVLGFAFDGTGYGHDGTIWGGEVLRATAHAADRLAHLVPVPLPGGDAAIEHPARIALAHLRAADVTVDETIPAVAAIPPDQRRLLDRQFTSGFGCVPTTSMGRLFDAVASIVGLRHAISYEAQAAIDLEHAARDNREAAAAYAFDLDGPHLDQRPVVAAIAADVRAGRSVAAIADGFHTAVAHAVCGLADRHATNGQVVVLSGGVFQNALLTERTVARLRDRGHDVRTHRLVPPNDGGLALGQAFIATHANAAEEH